MLKRPPDWLVAFVPWLGDRRAKKAWREWFEDTRIPDFVTGVTASKVLETIIVMTGPTVNLAWHLLWTDPLRIVLAPGVLLAAVAWESAGELWLYVVTTFACFVVSVFRFHLSQAASAAKETAEETVEAAGDVVEGAADAVEETVEAAEDAVDDISDGDAA